jgi:hypothetical protein
MTDGAAGGREEGDVELALFRRLTGSTESLLGAEAAVTTAPAPGPAPYRPFARYPYARDPLSMFSAARDRILSRAGSRRDVTTAETETVTPTDAVAMIRTGNEGPTIGAHAQVEGQGGPLPEHLGIQDLGAGLRPGVESASSEENYREAMVRACATLLGKTVEELQQDYDASGGPGQGEISPRDFADYAIMTTLKTRDAFAIHNAPSWLFTIMDRSGAGYVLREEFVKYAPFMAPMADAAIAATIFDELIRAQVAASQNPRASSEKQREIGQKGAARSARARDSGSNKVTPVTRQSSPQNSVNPTRELYPISAALRFATWKRYFDSMCEKIHPKDDDWERVKRELGLDPSERLIKAQGAVDHSDMWPTLGKLFLSQRYIVFFAAVGRNHYVARLGAVTEVGMRSFPILMRDCFTVKLESEATSAMNGVSAPVDATTLLSRSAAKRPRSRSKSVNDRCQSSSLAPRGQNSNQGAGLTAGGISGTTMKLVTRVGTAVADKRSRDGDAYPNDSNEGMAVMDTVEGEEVVGDDTRLDNGGQEGSGTEAWSSNEIPLPQHVQNVMKQFTEGDKPLVFSFIELRDTRQRDLWRSVVKEMADAHRLHLQLGFGGSGRVIPKIYSGVDPKSIGTLQVSAVTADTDGGSAAVGESLDSDRNGDGGSGYMTYLMSPFRNEPPPPLLAVAANANVFRYCAIKEVSLARDPIGLLVFSHPERYSRSVTWYVDSVRTHDDRAGRSWIERAFGAIRENMELNKRVYHVQDDEPFDVARLGEGIGRLAELCTPAARLFQFLGHLVQWRNPPATILVLLGSMYLVHMGWVKYLPSAALFLQAGLVVATRSRTFGLDGWMWGGGRPEDARQRQANVLELVAQVHDTLRAGQNVIKRLNHGLGKVQTLCLWGAGEEWKSWVFVGLLCGLGVGLAALEARHLFALAVFMLFSRHFMPPRNLGRRFWASVPPRVVAPDHATAVAGGSTGTAANRLSSVAVSKKRR